MDEKRSGELRDERPHAEKKLGVFYSPSQGAARGGYIVPMEPLSVGPGEAGPEDEPLITKFHEKLSERSVYLRYFQPLKLSTRTAHERLTRICFIDYDREMALVAERKDPATGETKGGLTMKKGENYVGDAQFELATIADPGPASAVLGRVRTIRRQAGGHGRARRGERSGVTHRGRGLLRLHLRAWRHHDGPVIVPHAF